MLVCTASSGEHDRSHLAGCAWTSQSNASWIAIVGAGSGSGNGTVSYTVAAYTGKPKKRSGTMTIAGQTVTVRQSR
jgi:hypothetical protein